MRSRHTRGCNCKRAVSSRVSACARACAMGMARNVTAVDTAYASRQSRTPPFPDYIHTYIHTYIRTVPIAIRNQTMSSRSMRCPSVRILLHIQLVTEDCSSPVVGV